MHGTIRITLACFVMAASFASFGCREDVGEIEKKIIANDPSFQKILGKRDSMIEELATQKTDYLSKRIQIDEEMNALKEKKSLMRATYGEEIERTKRRLNPEKRTLERDLMEAARNSKHIKSQVSDINSDIKEISDLIGKKDKLSLTQEEMKTWNDRLTALIEKKEDLTREKNKLDTDIEITKMKLKALNVE